MNNLTSLFEENKKLALIGIYVGAILGIYLVTIEIIS